MVLLNFTEEEFLHLGLKLAGWTQNRLDRNSDSNKIMHFKNKYYASPTTCSDIFLDIQTETMVGESKITKANPTYFLLSLYYLKKGPNKLDMADYINGSATTALKHCKIYIDTIQALLKVKVRWLFNDVDFIGQEVFIVSVDGVHCPIWEPRWEPSTKWYSKKFNGPGLVYELGIAIHHNNLVWVNGPFPAGKNDWSIFSMENGLMAKIPQGKKAVGDGGYTYNPSKISIRNSAFDTDEVNEFKERVKARHETFNARLKAFEILSKKFKITGPKRMVRHKSVFESCCVIAQYEMESGRPLFKV